MAGKKARRRVAIAIQSQILTPSDALAMVIVTTAATFACDNFELFQQWMKENTGKHGIETEEITKEAMLLSIGRMLRIMPEEL